MRMLNESDSNDVSVSLADQSSINAFSRYNTRLTSTESALKAAREELDALEEVEMEVELLDEDEDEVLYKLADSFVSVAQPRALSLLAQDKARVSGEIARLEGVAHECEGEMERLKVALYAKFGSNINLERD